MLKYFKGSILLSVIGAFCAYGVGYYYSGTTGGALSALFLAAVLSVLEVSLSFDNAVVNAIVLKKMTPLWQHRFLTWGIAIAVFGMRFPSRTRWCYGPDQSDRCSRACGDEAG